MFKKITVIVFACIFAALFLSCEIIPRETTLTISDVEKAISTNADQAE
jgi:hypothetical protein